MSVSPPRRARSGIVASAFLALFTFTGVVQALSDVDYPDVTNTRRSYVDFNIEVVRGFVYRTSPSFECFSVNAYESTIVRHTSLSGAPVSRWPTLTNPVSIAFDGTDLLVVGQGNHALARHDSATGEIKDVIMLGSEPADIVVDDETDKAYVSCMGDDSVWEIDISGTSFALGKIWAPVKTDAMPSAPYLLSLKRPRFLYLDKGGSGTADNFVFVSPFISGNNTLTFGPNSLLPQGVYNGNDLTQFSYVSADGGSGLPDVDLFRLNPSSGAVDRMLRRVGSLIAAHGRNPVTGAYWLLNVKELNLSAFSEPALRGKFATNALSIAATLPAAASAPLRPATHIDLDDTTTGGALTYQADRSVSFPYALDFDGSGNAVVGSSTTPMVVVVNSAGSRQRELGLAASGAIQGRVVRTVKYHGTNVLAYCQQTSNIAVFDLSSASNVPASQMTLGNDPTPPSVKAGRGIWYDATRSLDGRTTCNTCHPQGGSDSLIWQIGDLPVDDKGPLVTQPLLGIEDTFPYHWRGERTLADFNGAFPGLLGATAELDPTELADFEEFVFSLRPPANPRQDRYRTVDDDLITEVQGQGIASSPVRGFPSKGLDLFQTHAADTTGACARCHTFPTGSTGDFVPERAETIAARTNFEIAHLNNQLVLKAQPIVDVLVDVAGVPTAKAFSLLGTGLRANGLVASAFEFVDTQFGGASFSDQDVADLSAFLHLFDTGTAPSVHWAVRLNQASSNSTLVRNQLLLQAGKGWVGVVARGTYPVGTTPTIEKVNWYYDPSIQRMVPDRTSFPSGTLGNQTWTQFDAATQAGTADNVFFGVPPGNEHRLGADMDNDGLDYGAELALSPASDPWNPDSDGDGHLDGYEVANGSSPTNASSVPTDTTYPTLLDSGKVELDFSSAKVAKLKFRTSEPVQWTFTLTTPAFSTAPVVDTRKTFDTFHTAVVQALHPSPNQGGTTPPPALVYSWTLELKDRAGLTTTISNSGAPAQPDVTAGEIVLNNAPVVGQLAFTSQVRTGSTYNATFTIRLDRYEGAASPAQVIEWVPIVQVLKQVPGTTNDWERVPAADFTIQSLNSYDDFFMDLDQNSATPAQSYSADVLPGPYLVCPSTGSTGYSGGSFEVRNLATGQHVMVNVLGGLWDEGNTTVPTFAAKRFQRFLFPGTPKALRNIVSSP